MIDKHLLHDIKHISLSLFHKNFFSVYHGSISARMGASTFIINSQDAILDEITEDSLIKLDCQKRDYRWSLANSDAHIHELIYKTIPNAKFVCYTMPPYATAFSIKHGKVSPQDYYGKKILGDILVYDPKNIDDWIERAPHEIHKFFQNNDTHLLLIKGFGVICYDRDLTEMIKKLSILENSCRILALSSNL